MLSPWNRRPIAEVAVVCHAFCLSRLSMSLHMLLGNLPMKCTGV